MIDRDGRDARFRDLLDQYCGDAIDEEGLLEFEAILREDASARREFAAYFQLHSELEAAFRVGRPADDAGEREPGSPGSPPRRLGPGPRTWSALALAAAVLLGGLTLSLRPTLRRAARAPSSAPATAPAGTSASTTAGSGALATRPRVAVSRGLAMVVRLEGVRWEPSDGPPPAEGDLLAPGRFRFLEGRATLAMLNGVALVVEGPADLELVSDVRVVCNRGRLRARVPEESEGFVVSGPGSAVLDLGTEFGLNIEPDGMARGKVFDGFVEAALLDEEGSHRRSRLMSRESHAFAIDPRAGRIGADVGPEDFVTGTSPEVRPLALDDGYRDAVMDAGPWGYWRFESLADGLVPDEVPGRPPLRAVGPIRLSDRSSGNATAVFGPGQHGQYLTLEEAWNPPRHPGYAVELWALPEAIGHLALACMLADDPRAAPPAKPSDLHFNFLLEMTSRTPLQALHKPAAVRLLHRYPPGWYHSSDDNVYSQDCYVPYRWHHVVAQMNEDRMELFLDGRPTPSLTVDPAATNRPCQLLIGRLTTIPADGDQTSRPFVGRMDEIALYDRPLAAEEIRRHYRMARSD